jgi:signal peptidase I
MRISIIALALLVLTIGCSERRFHMTGSTVMLPAIQPNETVMADMAAFHKSEPQRWDVVVFHPPPASKTTPAAIWVMRVIGLPGENLEIREDGVYINGRLEAQPDRLSGIHYVSSIPVGFDHPTISYPYQISAGAYFLVGDNTTNSFDSRFWGAVPRQSILGKVKGAVLEK